MCYRVVVLPVEVELNAKTPAPGVDMAELATTPPALDDDYPLTQQQIDSFRENSFVYLPSVCSPAEVAYFREAIARVTYEHNDERRPLVDRRIWPRRPLFPLTGTVGYPRCLRGERKGTHGTACFVGEFEAQQPSSRTRVRRSWTPRGSCSPR